MKILEFNREKSFKHQLKEAIDNNISCDYLYSYPPRQAYYQLTSEDIAKGLLPSFESSEDIDLYLHFPFCRQICSFCNLYATNKNSTAIFEKYVDTIISEAKLYSDIIKKKRVQTIYLGGGTPSLLSAANIGKILNFFKDSFEVDVYKLKEVSLEV